MPLCSTRHYKECLTDEDASSIVRNIEIQQKLLVSPKTYCFVLDATTDLEGNFQFELDYRKGSGYSEIAMEEFYYWTMLKYMNLSSFSSSSNLMQMPKRNAYPFHPDNAHQWIGGDDPEDARYYDSDSDESSSAQPDQLEIISRIYEEAVDKTAARSLKQRIDLNDPIHKALQDDVNFARIRAVMFRTQLLERTRTRTALLARAKLRKRGLRYSRGLAQQSTSAPTSNLGLPHTDSVAELGTSTIREPAAFWQSVAIALISHSHCFEY